MISLKDIFVKKKALSDFSSRQVDSFNDPRNPLLDRILKIMTSSYVRIGYLDEPTELMLKNKIRLSIENNDPITIILGLGWGKNISSYSAPSINWAEFFHLKFLSDVLFPICTIYDQGVRIEITPDSYAVRIINGYKSEWLQQYEEGFRSILSYFKSKLPHNYVHKLRLSDEWYEYDALEKEISSLAESIKNDKKKSEEIIQSRIKNAKNNFVPNKGEPKQEYRNRVRDSVLKHNAWIQVDYMHRKEYLEGGNHIPIAHRKGIPGTYNLRNLPSSLVQFWKGDGVIRRKGEKYTADIISPRQYRRYESESLIDMVEIDNPTCINSLDKVPMVSE